jgi:hypothetical protein
MKLNYSHHVFARRSIDLRTNVSCIIWAELLSTSYSETRRSQLSATSVRPIVYSKGCIKCCMQWGSTLGNPVISVKMIRPIQTIFGIMITQVSYCAIRLDALIYSFNSMRSRNICHMPQQMYWMILRNVSIQEWNQRTVCGMNSYISWISS